MNDHHKRDVWRRSIEKAIFDNGVVYGDLLNWRKLLSRHFEGFDE